MAQILGLSECKVRFDSYDDFVAFQTEAEGMWDNARDDEEVGRVAMLHDLIQVIENQLDPRAGYPFDAAIPAHLVDMARQVAENIESNQ